MAIAKTIMNGKKSSAGGSKSNNIPPLPRDFISSDNPSIYQYSFGRLVASSFSGFIAGIIVTSLIWVVIVDVFFIG